MRIKVIRDFNRNRVGEVITVGDSTAKQYIDKGFALPFKEPVDEFKEEKRPAPQTKQEKFEGDPLEGKDTDVKNPTPEPEKNAAPKRKSTRRPSKGKK